MLILQPDIEGQSEPHLIALMSDHTFTFIEYDPDTMHLKEAIIQPYREELIKSMKKGIFNITSVEDTGN